MRILQFCDVLLENCIDTQRWKLRNVGFHISDQACVCMNLTTNDCVPVWRLWTDATQRYLFVLAHLTQCDKNTWNYELSWLVTIQHFLFSTNNFGMDISRLFEDILLMIISIWKCRKGFKKYLNLYAKSSEIPMTLNISTTPTELEIDEGGQSIWRMSVILLFYNVLVRLLP